MAITFSASHLTALVRADLLAVDVDRPLVTRRANADEHALILPAAWDVGRLHVPGQVEIAKEIFVLLVPAARHRDRARFSQAVEPAVGFTHLVRIDLEVPDAGEIQLVANTVLDWVKHVYLLLADQVIR
jgi:hypothetical protein